MYFIIYLLQEYFSNMDDATVIAHIQKQLKGKPHVCTKSCNARQINVHIHERDGLHIRWSRNNRPWMSKKTFRRALQYVYVCLDTNTVHQCTENCALEPIPNDDHTLVCPISGVQWNNETEVVRSWKLTSKCVPTIISDKRDPNMYSRNEDGVVLSATLNIKNESCKREVEKFLHLFVCSHVRKCQEIEKYKQGYSMAMKQANKYIKFCKKKGIINICTLQNIITTETFSKPIFLRTMDQYVDKIDSIVEAISPIILKLWNLVVVPRQIAFDVFVPAMLYILQRGIAVNGVNIVATNRLLDIMLPDANTLNDFGVTKSTFTQTKNTIRMSIRNLLKKYTVDEIKEMIH